MHTTGRTTIAASAICAACLAACGWLWFRHSHPWHVTTREIVEGFRSVPFADRRAEGLYVLVTGTFVGSSSTQEPAECILINDAKDTDYPIGVTPAGLAGDMPLGGELSVAGRVHWHFGPISGGTGIHIDTEVARLAPQSIVGILVGVFGCAVLGVTLMLDRSRAAASESRSSGADRPMPLGVSPRAQ